MDINSQEDTSDPDELDEPDEEDALPPVVFSVNITKEDKMMTFSCEADGSGIIIRNVSLTGTQPQHSRFESSSQHASAPCVPHGVHDFILGHC